MWQGLDVMTLGFIIAVIGAALAVGIVILFDTFRINDSLIRLAFVSDGWLILVGGERRLGSSPVLHWVRLFNEQEEGQ